MSGSPKYSQIVRAAARRAAEEEARRRAAERRARAEAVRRDSARLRARRHAEQAQRSARQREQRLAEQERAAVHAAREGAARRERQAAADSRASQDRDRERARLAAASRTEAVAVLRARLGAVEDVTGGFQAVRDQCTAQLSELDRALARPDGGVYFDSLVGTVEHAVARFQRGVRRAEQERAAEREALAEAQERLAEIGPQAEIAAADAPEADLPELAEELTALLEQARRAVRRGPAAQAADLVTRLEELTAQAEVRLDEAVIVAQRRAELAEALKQAMTAQGLYYQGGGKDAGRMTLRFARANGAIYTAQISELAENGESLLTYAVSGESELITAGTVGSAVCDQTESLLDSVHQALGPHGFEAGETVWVGKPTRSDPPPGSAAGRVSSGGNRPSGTPARARTAGNGEEDGRR